MSPFTLWLRIPALRRIQKKEQVSKEAETKPEGGGAADGPSSDLRPNSNGSAYHGIQSQTDSDLEQGEVILLDRPEEAKTQLFNLCSKYLLLQAFR